MSDYLVTLAVAFVAFLGFILALLKTQKKKKGVNNCHCMECDEHECVCQKKPVRGDS